MLCRRFAAMCAMLPAAAVLTGCGGGGGAAGGSPTGGRSDTSVPAIYRDAVIPPAGMQVVISADKQTYRSGEPIRLTIRVTNGGTQPRTITYPDTRPQWGYIISQGGNTVVSECSAAHTVAFAQVITGATYQPGETRTFTVDFPLSFGPGDPPALSALPAGTYSVCAKGATIGTGSPTPVSAPISVTVTP